MNLSTCLSKKMTWRELIDQLQKMDQKHLDDNVVICFEITKDCYPVESLKYLSNSMVLEIGQ